MTPAGALVVPARQRLAAGQVTLRRTRGGVAALSVARVFAARLGPLALGLATKVLFGARNLPGFGPAPTRLNLTYLNLT